MLEYGNNKTNWRREVPRVQTPKDLRCRKCDACIAPNGQLTCMRCKQSVDIALAEMDGFWYCPGCLEHGKDPKTLAKDGAIQCKFCKHENPIPKPERGEAKMESEIYRMQTRGQQFRELADRPIESVTDESHSYYYHK